MEPKISLPCLQKLATEPYPKADDSSSHVQTRPIVHYDSFFKISSHLRLVLPNDFFSSGFLKQDVRQ
jgi:hypothetical protein